MTETFQFRIAYKYSYLLFEENEGINLGQITKSVKIINLTKNDRKFYQIPVIDKLIKERFNKSFYLGWSINRRYTKKEVENSKYFLM